MKHEHRPQPYLLSAVAFLVVLCAWYGAFWALENARIKAALPLNLDHHAEAVAALFSALAFAAVIVSLWYQHHDLAVQRHELSASVDAQVEASNALKARLALEERLVGTKVAIDLESEARYYEVVARTVDRGIGNVNLDELLRALFVTQSGMICDRGEFLFAGTHRFQKIGYDKMAEIIERFERLAAYLAAKAVDEERFRILFAQRLLWIEHFLTEQLKPFSVHAHPFPDRVKALFPSLLAKSVPVFEDPLIS